MQCTAARRDLSRLIEEGAPVGVIAAAQEAIHCAEQGGAPRTDILGVLLDYCALRQGQNRWGGSLLGAS